MKDKADNPSGREKDILTQAYKSYADYSFPNNETRHPCCENATDSVLCTPTNHECKLPNWKCVLRKCTVRSSIDLPGVDMDSSNRAPMIMFNTYMTQFTCSHHGILIREKSPLMWMQRENLKGLVSYVKKKTKTPDFTRGNIYERVKLFSMQRNIGDFHKEFYIK